MLTLPDPYSTCGVEADPDVVVETVLRTVGRTVIVWVVERMVVVTVGRSVVVTGLSRVEGRYVNRVGTRYVEDEPLKEGKGVVDRRYVVVLRVDVVDGRVDVVVFTVTTESEDDVGRVVFGAIVVVTGLGVVVVVGSVVGEGVWVVVTGLTVEVDVVKPRSRISSSHPHCAFTIPITINGNT
jgi:hypothetical protein